MDHNSYSMKKLGYQAKDQHRPKSNNCSFYVRYCLLCTSIIQLLIILGLVLFMVYGNNHSSQQSHLKNTHNQSVQFMEEIRKLQHFQGIQTRVLNMCQYRKGNLTERLNKVTDNLRTCVKPKNGSRHQFVSYYHENTIGAKQGMLPVNYTIVLKQLSKLRDDQELSEAKQRLNETRLNSQKRELLKQIQDLKGNCTSMSRDFQAAMDTVRANYEAGFRGLTGGLGYPYNAGLDRQLDRIKANCTPLSLNFQADVQRKLLRFDADVKKMWQESGEQKLRADTLEMMNNDCKQEADRKAEQFSKRESKQQQDTERVLAERVALLQERNSLRNQLTALTSSNPHLNSPARQGSTKPATPTCRAQLDTIAHLSLILDVKNRIITEKDEVTEGLRKKLKVQERDCSLQMEQQKLLACRALG
ncbi:uncharacterized protein LOC144607052 isoform X2 [Rhinoraja longicauda]